MQFKTARFWLTRVLCGLLLLGYSIPVGGVVANETSYLGDDAFEVGYWNENESSFSSHGMVEFENGQFSHDASIASGTLGNEAETIRIKNNSAHSAWSLTLSSENSSSVWQSENDNYYYNHPTNELLGRLTVDPSGAFLASECDYSTLSLGNIGTFQEGVVDHIDLVSASGSTPAPCDFDIWDISLSQTVPASQSVGVYTLPMVLTITAIPTEPSAPLNLTLTPSDEDIFLEWEEPEASGDGEILGYKIERYSSSWDVLVANTESTETFYSDMTTVFGVEYFYRVSAINAIGTGEPSEEKMAFMVFIVHYSSTEGGTVAPSYQQVGLGSNTDPPEITNDDNYIFEGFEITSGEGGGSLDVSTGVVTDVNDNMSIQANFVYSPTFEVVQLAAGEGHSLALDDEGYVWAWGFNASGQLGHGNDIDSMLPRKVVLETDEALSDIVYIAAGANHSLAVDEDGYVWAWGLNEFGQLGDGTEDDSNIPVMVVDAEGYLEDIASVEGGDGHSLALGLDGSVYSWGLNESGQLGFDNNGDSNIAVQVVGGDQGGEFLVDIEMIAIGDFHSMALDSEGRVWSWGDNNLRQLGDGRRANRNSPVRVRGAQQGNTPLENIVMIGSGSNHGLALEDSGDLRAWGSNEFGQLGDDTTSEARIPIRVLSGEQGNHTYLEDIYSVSGGKAHSLMLDDEGELWSWGSNEFGQLGDDKESGEQVLTPISTASSIEGIQMIVSGANHNLVLDDEGNIWSWGANEFGQLGDGTDVDQHEPVMLEFTNSESVESSGVEEFALDLEESTSTSIDDEVDDNRVMYSMSEGIESEEQEEAREEDGEEESDMNDNVITSVSEEEPELRVSVELEVAQSQLLNFSLREGDDDGVRIVDYKLWESTRYENRDQVVEFRVDYVPRVSSFNTSEVVAYTSTYNLIVSSVVEETPEEVNVSISCYQEIGQGSNTDPP